MPAQKRILLVDDEEAILFAFRQILRSPELLVDTAATVEKAKELIASTQYSGVVADLRLSGATNIEGYEVVQFARETQPKCVVIVLTAYGGDDTKKRVSELGADCYLEKPVSPQAVKEILRARGAI